MEFTVSSVRHDQSPEKRKGLATSTTCFLLHYIEVVSACSRLPQFFYKIPRKHILSLLFRKGVVSLRMLVNYLFCWFKNNE